MAFRLGYVEDRTSSCVLLETRYEHGPPSVSDGASTCHFAAVSEMILYRESETYVNSSQSIIRLRFSCSWGGAGEPFFSIERRL
jgi:hypothetical protein